ncbi:hypothetical protein PFDG_03050 [Plasmodium falciparum Dd2]|uniref:Uncharacterized protein n=1 Tax=Plasmodium falciparum (isolate Dd2) TaxID=57267 RepID=A0A0L7M2E5_PLAF4|nr:hypothetical protein PFDG_03050 [Plasmodium falciparum Dd2]
MGKGYKFPIHGDRYCHENTFPITSLNSKTIQAVVVFNPYKRIRYAKLNEDLTAAKENIEKLLEKISGGDAKFTMLKRQTLPEFIQDPNAAKANEKDEL